MLPPVLEIYVVWHPDDDSKGRPLADSVIDHFHGDQFSGLIGGAVEVCFRSAGWTGLGSIPRPIPMHGDAGAGPSKPAAFVAILVLLGNGLAGAVSDNATSPWADYLEALKDSEAHVPDRIRVYATKLDGDAASDAALTRLFGDRQFVGASDALHQIDQTLFLRDLSQTLAQFLTGNSDRLQVFVSHTKHTDETTQASTVALIEAVREEIRHTHLGEFFDSHSIQAGEKWEDELKQNAASGALLSLRTDRYASREWCQREVAIAKTNGVPVVTLDALDQGEQRGSFILDHAPRLPALREGDGWARISIRRALTLLVDECLKRVIWRRQEDLAGPTAGVQWWAPHAPEPFTLADWMSKAKLDPTGPVIILHPDPPLTACEREILDTMVALTNLTGRLEVMTPRSFAARSCGASP